MIFPFEFMFYGKINMENHRDTATASRRNVTWAGTGLLGVLACFAFVHIVLC